MDIFLTEQDMKLVDKYSELIDSSVVDLRKRDETANLIANRLCACINLRKQMKETGELKGYHHMKKLDEQGKVLTNAYKGGTDEYRGAQKYINEQKRECK